jgi:cytochrome c1
MTVDEAFTTIEEWEEQASEIAAEVGMGAVSMGFDPYDAMAVHSWEQGPEPEGIREARAVVADYKLVRVIRPAVAIVDHADDLPF